MRYPKCPEDRLNLGVMVAIDDLEALSEIAARQDRTRSQIVRQIIREYVAAHQSQGVR